MYFVATNPSTGETKFAVTEAQFETLKAEYNAWQGRTRVSDGCLRTRPGGAPPSEGLAEVTRSGDRAGAGGLRVRGHEVGAEVDGLVLGDARPVEPVVEERRLEVGAEAGPGSGPYTALV